jgi:hypothetical protein
VHVAKNLARGVDDHRSRLEGDARSERRLTCAVVLAVKLGKRPLDR